LGAFLGYVQAHSLGFLLVVALDWDWGCSDVLWVDAMFYVLWMEWLTYPANVTEANPCNARSGHVE
jgi:hypothetical protein